jgi:hypothetical protein
MFMDDDHEDGNGDNDDDPHHHKCFPIKNHNTNAGILNIYCTMFCTTIVLGMQHGFGQWKHFCKAMKLSLTKCHTTLHNFKLLPQSR